MTQPVVNALTIDVEDWFQVSALADSVDRADWVHMESRVERNTERLLELFAQAGVRGTFFVLGWVAERKPALVRRIAEAGHEIASHGYSHRLVYEQT
ncbi:MAG TPA: polysaccharide deacetylase family protein, partial [Gammaproteobacteria bacterium]|nr:polysaccharide deacetylase family protein [Gammaproteobacteria bacterium]